MRMNDNGEVAHHGVWRLVNAHVRRLLSGGLLCLGGAYEEAIRKEEGKDEGNE